MQFEPVIGLEVHVQAKTKTKLFCNCACDFGKEQNSNICPVCTGQPGALPVLNKEAVAQAIRAGLATNCKINQKNVFARKNYFYPDLPKGYQISQFDKPICEHGFVEIELKDYKKKIRLTRIHMEEDAGKNVHQGADGILDSNYSMVDLNRACTPLLEIVSEPDLESIEEVRAYLDQLKLIMQYMGVSDADMEKGQLRVDVNVSLKKIGADKLGTRAEIKNMNSFRGIEKAIKYEIERQTDILLSGKTVDQETRNYDDNTGTTTTLRSKEEAHDYRYFPEPDLLPLLIEDEWLAHIKETLPKSPMAKKEQYTKEFGLSDYDCEVLLNNKDLALFFEATTANCKQAKLACNWLTTDITGFLKEKGLNLKNTKLSPKNLAKMIDLIANNTISSKIAKEILPVLILEGKDIETVVKELGLEQISDASELEKIIIEIIQQNPNQVSEYKAGKDKLLGFFVGQVMKKTQGRANPEKLNKLLKDMLLK